MPSHPQGEARLRTEPRAAPDPSALFPQHRAFQEQHHAFPGSEEATAVPWALRDLTVPPHSHSSLQSEREWRREAAGSPGRRDGGGLGAPGICPGARDRAEV